jgi:DNA-binding response OmpR family regulator
MDHTLNKDAFFFVVAEDQGIQAMTAAALSVEGFHRVLTFARATDVLQAKNTILPHMYVIDYELSGISGFELYELVQPEGKVIPCILLNAPLLLTKENYPLWTLRTPFTLEEFFACVKEALRYISSQIHSGPML